MFLKRSSLARKKPSGFSRESDNDIASDDNKTPETGPVGTELLKRDDSTNFSIEDSGVSFRRGLRDGTITNKLDLSQNQPLNTHKKVINNLSFTDSLVEDELNNIHLRKAKMTNLFVKKRFKKGIDLSNSKQNTDKYQFPAKNIQTIQEDTNLVGEERRDFEDKHESEYSDEDEESDDYSMDIEGNFVDEVESIEESDDMVEESSDEKVSNSANNVEFDDYVVPLYELSEVESDFDIELELSQIVDTTVSEVQILKRNLESNQTLLNQNIDKITKLEMEKAQLEKHLTVYSNLLETSSTLSSLVSSKLQTLLVTLDKIKKNRIEEIEYLLRMRRWLYCDFLRLSGVSNFDYNCGELEDIDEMGKDLSQTIERQFDRRLKGLDDIKNDLVKTSVRDSAKFKFSSLKEYLTNKVRDLFTVKLGTNYTFSQLSELYEYEISLEQVDTNLMSDVTEEFCTISACLEPFLSFKETNPTEYNSLNLAGNLKNVILFFVKVSILTWDPLKQFDLKSLEWFNVLLKFDPNMLPLVVDEVLFLLSMNSIEYFDIESYEQSHNLAELLKFVMQNSSQDNKPNNVEKIISSLIKSINSKVSVVSFRLNSKDSSFMSSMISDPVVLHIIKFSYLNLIANLMCFSDILSGTTLSTMVVDDLFLNKLLPLLDFESAVDAFVVLNFYTLTLPISRLLQIKTKNTSIVKLTFQHFCESEWTSRSNSDIFNSLSIPMNNKSFSKLINF
uniref:Uncharacterized protein n=1 Tax=Theileria annulata TaxID=5874 RepID=A0A3B0NFF3_THEAN